MLDDEFSRIVYPPNTLQSFYKPRREFFSLPDTYSLDTLFYY
jgi:hypothetical protein